MFEAEWHKNLFAAGLRRVRGKFSLKQFQVFDLLHLCRNFVLSQSRHHATTPGLDRRQLQHVWF